ncbi:MAG: glycerol-3-phosphate acyltransferase [Chloroflexi bacterium]|nr:glycerol-3-phosphate acyltransferase [Chloroflexota bacterium]
MPVCAAVAISIVAGYALGSLPWAYVAARRRGIAIGEVDTRIAGTANVFRQVGPAWGVLVFLGDAGKGAGAVVLANAIGAEGALALPALAAAIAGHNWPLLGLSQLPGGVGLATLSGGCFGAAWLIALPSTALGVAMIFVLRNTGVGAGFGLALYAVLGVVTGLDPWVMSGLASLGVLVVVWAKVRR